MEASRSFRTALCLYECLRLFFLIGAFLLLEPAGKADFPWLALISPGAIFLLIALFWRLDLPHYRIYAPLYLAGKGLSIITTMFWIFYAKSYMIKGLFLDRTASDFWGLFFAGPGIVIFLLIGDIFSVWLVRKIMKSE